MIKRSLSNIAFSDEWGKQMRFITGPRQSGKTTLAKLQLTTTGCSDLYYLWDLRSIKNRYKDNEFFFTKDKMPNKKKSWICFDEIHKMPKWRNILKGIYDISSENYQFIVTGSAKFDIFRRVGDSLSGRYFTFHLSPLSLTELYNPDLFTSAPPESANNFIKNKLDLKNNSQEELSTLLEYSGFPDPFLSQSKKFLRKWSQDYLDTIIKEDIGALTRIVDRENLFDLYKLLPETVGNPISDSSFASHLQVSPHTIKNYLKTLQDFYLCFLIHPFSKNIKRSLLKAPKCYLYNWTNIDDPGKRFENFVAVELKTQINLWMEASGEYFDLFYIRNKSKQETDFLITRNQKPWLLIEVKLSDSSISKHHFDTQSMLNNIPLIQLTRQNNICMLQTPTTYRLSASIFF